MPYIKCGGPHVRYYTIQERTIMGFHIACSAMIGYENALNKLQHKTINQKILEIVTLHGMCSRYNSKDDTINVSRPSEKTWIDMSSWTIVDMYTWLGYRIKGSPDSLTA